MNPVLEKLAACGQSIWYDNIRRGMLVSGELATLAAEGVRGVTSNPSIFHKAISGSSDYDAAIADLVTCGADTLQIYDALTIADIAAAADVFRPLYDATDGRDGFVSLEVNPRLAYDTAGTVVEATRLFAALNRPNVMIKIPATPPGLPAIAAVLGAGINVNVTLIFSVDVYVEVMQAYLAGLRTWIASGGRPQRLASVASFFVSRLDTAIDARLDEKVAQGRTDLAQLKGRAAVANSRLAYVRFREVFSGPQFAGLQAAGARVQRPLWASTSTKNPAYSPTLYVDTLIGPDTVNTVPPETLTALRRGMPVEPTISRDLDQARDLFEGLATEGILLSTVTDELRTAGVQAFASASEKLLLDLEGKRQACKAR